MRALKIWWLCVVGCMLAGCVIDEEKDEDLGNIVNVGDSVPAFVLTGPDGEEMSSASLKGQVYVLSFFDTTCPDCQKEFPVLQQIYDKYNETVKVFNVPRSQPMDQVEVYWSKEGLTMPVYTASDKDLYYKFATSHIPRTFIVDGEGKVRAMFSDNPLPDFGTIDSVLKALLTHDAPSGVL